MQSSNDKTEGPGVPHEPSMASSRLSYSPPSGAAASAQSIPHHPSATKSQSDDLALEHSGSQGSLLGPRLEIPTFTQSSSMMGSANAWGPRSAITTPVSAGSASSGSDRLPGIALLDQFLGSPWQGAITPVDEASGKPPALPALSIGPSITASGSQPSSQAPAILDGPSRLHTQDAYASSSSPSGFYPPPLDPRRQGMPSGQAGVSPITRGNMSPLWDAREPSSLDNTLFNQSNRQFTGAGRSDAGKQPAFDASPSMPFWPGSRSVVGTNQQQPQRQDYTQPEPPQLEHIQPQHLIDLQHQQQQQQRPSGMPAYPRAGGQSSAYDSPSSLKRKAPFTDSYYPGVPLPSLMQPQRSTSSSHYSDSDRRADLSSLENMRAEKAPEDWERRAMSGMAMSSTVPDVQVKAEPLPTGMGDFSAFRPQTGPTLSYPGQQQQQQQVQSDAQQQPRYNAAAATGLASPDRFVAPSAYSAPGGGASSVATGSTSTYIPPATQHNAAGGAARSGSTGFRRRGKLPKQVTDLLKAWLLDHALHPYPTDEEKQRLCAATGLTTNQVSNWFINARRRILVPTSNGGFAVGGSAADPSTQQQQQQQPPQQTQQQQLQQQQQQHQQSSDLPASSLEYSRENGWR